MEEAAQTIAKIESTITKKQSGIESTVEMLYDEIRKMASAIESEIGARNAKIESELQEILQSINEMCMKKTELEESMNYFKDNLNEILSGKENKS